MRFLFLAALLLFSILFNSESTFAKFEINLSKEVYKKVPYSSQFLSDGALIRNVNFQAVNKLIPQLQEYLGNKKLTDRGESHITVITPPEGKGWAFNNQQGVNGLISQEELHQKYFQTMQNKKFEIVCIGERKSEKGNHVFYLVVKSTDLVKVRAEVQRELELRAEFTNSKISFNANDFYPHITIGYIGGDVHNVSKGPETCVEDIQLIIK